MTFNYILDFSIAFTVVACGILVTLLVDRVNDNKYRLDVAMQYNLVYGAYHGFLNTYKSKIKEMIKKIEAKSDYN